MSSDDLDDIPPSTRAVDIGRPAPRSSDERLAMHGDSNVLQFPVRGFLNKKLWALSDNTIFDSVTIDVVSIQSNLEPQDTGSCIMKHHDLEGNCVVIKGQVNGQSFVLGRARLYHIQHYLECVRECEKYFVIAILGDIKLGNLLKRRGLHQVLVSIRFCLAFFCYGIFPRRILWAPGRFAYKGPGLGFLELPRSEFPVPRPPVLSRLANLSLEQNESLNSGLLCFDRDRSSEHARRARTLAMNGFLHLPSTNDGREALTIKAGDDLCAMILRGVNPSDSPAEEKQQSLPMADDSNDE